jgi:hypothetical protein
VVTKTSAVSTGGMANDQITNTPGAIQKACLVNLIDWSSMTNRFLAQLLHREKSHNWRSSLADPHIQHVSTFTVLESYQIGLPFHTPYVSQCHWKGKGEEEEEDEDEEDEEVATLANRHAPTRTRMHQHAVTRSSVTDSSVKLFATFVRTV